MNREKELTGAEFILNELSKCESFIELSSKLQIGFWGLCGAKMESEEK